MFLSVFSKKRPRMLTASTRSAGSDLMSIIVRTVSWRIEFPAFLVVSVLVQT
jgi:hypothetical protein